VKIYIITFDSGSYSDATQWLGKAFVSEKDAEHFVKTFDRLNKWRYKEAQNISNTVKKFQILKEFEMIGASHEERPHKTTLDPQNKISNKDWQTKYIDPWKKRENDFSRIAEIGRAHV
jgi:hypothetical protein